MSDGMMASLESAKDKVAWLLDKYPDTRDCDKTLYVYYLYFFCGLDGYVGKHVVPQVVTCIKQANTPETVRRVRQKYQEEGHYRGKRWWERQQDKVNVQYNINDLL